MMQISSSTALQSIHDEMQRLHRQVAERDAQIKILMRFAFMADELCERFGLNRQEYRFLCHLVSRAPEAVSFDELTFALYADKQLTPNSNILQVIVHRLREKLVRHAISIKTVPKFGYRLDLEDLDKLHAAGWELRE